MTSDVGLRSARGPILLAVMVATGIVAIDSTILATAVPSIVRDLGGFSQFPWLFSIYLLTQAVTVPVYSKLSDVFGRKPMILIGISIFLLGSILAGFAWSMPALIAFRAIQGLGAGAILPIAVTIVGDIYSVQERARVQGYLASVWAIAAVVGPTLGGLFTQYLTWPWIFFVNIPLCLVAGGLLIRNFHEKVERVPHRIDYAGTVLLTGGLTLIILGLLEGGQAWPWTSATSIGVFVGGAVLLAIFLVVERRVSDPILPLWVFTRRLLLTTTLLGLAVGAVLIGLTSYIPTYLEVALGTDPLIAGLALAALTIGWPLAATVSGRIYLRIGFRSTIIIGTAVMVLAGIAMVTIGRSPNVVAIAIVCFVMGFGLGLATVPSLVAAQSSVSWNERGVVTGNNLFARNVGSAVGVAVFGAVANGILGPDGGSDAGSMTAATEAVFVAVLIATLLAGVAALTIPKTPITAAARAETGPIGTVAE